MAPSGSAEPALHPARAPETRLILRRHAHAAVAQRGPQLVLCSRLSEVVETRCLAWVLLYPHRDARAVISVAGHRHTVPDPGVDGLLRIVDQTGLLAGDDAH